MKIGVFVPSHNLKRIQTILTSYKSVDFSFYPYKEIQEIRDAFKKNQEFLDGFFFTGLLSYTMVKDTYGEFSKPATFLETQEADFFRKMFEIMIDNPDIDLSRVFFDFHIESKELELLLNKIPEDRRPIIPINRELKVTDNVYNEIFEIHEHFHRENKVDWSFTRFSNIIPLLNEKGYKSHYFEVSSATIHSTLINLMNEINFRALKESQVACGIITINNIPEQLLRIKMLNLHSLLLDFDQKNNLSFVITEEDNYFEIMTTRGTVETLTDGYQYCSLLEFLNQYVEERIHLGWGFGKTFLHARKNANRAGQYSQNNKAGTTFIINDADELIGPLFGERVATTNSKNAMLTNQMIEKIIEETQMTRDKINKIILAFTQQQTSHVSSADFAKAIGVTVRTANRILKEAVDNRLLQSKDDTTAGLQGRPRKLYHINKRFLNDLNDEL